MSAYIQIASVSSVCVQCSMPKHYSVDLRWRAVWLVLLRKMTYAEVGNILFMSERSVRRYVDQYQSTGDVEPTKHKHGPAKMLNEVEMIIVIELLAWMKYKRNCTT